MCDMIDQFEEVEKLMKRKSADVRDHTTTVVDQLESCKSKGSNETYFHGPIRRAIL